MPVLTSHKEAGMAKKGIIKTTVALEEGLWKRARIRAIEEGVDLQDIVTKALERYLRTPSKAKGEGGR